MRAEAAPFYYGLNVFTFEISQNHGGFNYFYNFLHLLGSHSNLLTKIRFNINTAYIYLEEILDFDIVNYGRMVEEHLSSRRELIVRGHRDFCDYLNRALAIVKLLRSRGMSWQDVGHVLSDVGNLMLAFSAQIAPLYDQYSAEDSDSDSDSDYSLIGDCEKDTPEDHSE